MRRPWLFAVSLADAAFLYAPIAVLIVFSFNASRLSAGWRGFTLDWYRLLLRDEALWMAVQNSLVVAVGSTLLAVVLGLAGGMGLEGVSVRSQRIAEGVLLLPLIIPEVMLGVALMLFFVVLKWPLSLGTVMIGHAVFNLPIVMIIVRARLRKLDPRLIEAARDLGATPWRAFRRITLPLLRPALIGAGLMAFTLSLDDFIVTFFTAGPGATTLPLRVYSMIRSGVTPEINALSAVLVLMSMGLIGLALAVQRK
jgi:spermidine/putrescine transport system permease protein